MNNIARANVKVVSQSSTGLNTKVSVNGHIMTNNQAYNQAKQGKINGYNGSISSNGNGDKKKKSEKKSKSSDSSVVEE